LDPNKVYNIPAGNSPFKGPADAPVTLALFSDFQCPFCSQVGGLVDQVLKAYPKEVKFVYKEFPLVTIHQNAMPAARAAVAAGKQGKFWEMHDKLFANQRALQADNLKQYAKDIGLDAAKFEQDLASPDAQKEIDEDVKLAQQSQVSGTPTLFLNGKRVTNRTFEGLKQMVEEALKPKS
jgi:protein-disulfide isomerase